MPIKPWIISNKEDIRHDSSCELLVKTDVFKFYGSRDYFYHNNDEKTYVYVDGCVIPRNLIYDEYSHYRPHELIFRLYSEYGKSFITRVKGNYSIIVIHNNNFYIYSDRFGIKKFFYWKDGKDFIISNDLREITKRINVEPSAESIAIYALTYHFTGGRTLFADVMHNLPGQIVECNNGTFKTSYYWRPEQLLNLNKMDVQINDISNSLVEVIESNIKLIDQDSISLSLTGGADTRNLLAVFMKLGIRPHLYTYGNPDSADCSKAKVIAEGLHLDHKIHDIHMDATIFEDYARKIICLGDGLASIHRAHRLMAVEREKEFANTMFLGTLGGEFIKGVSEDDYIVPSIVYDNWARDKIDEKILINYLAHKKINSDIINKESIISFLNQEPYFQGDIINRKHNSLCYITAHLHDAQDVNLYNTVMNESFTPFLDIDYLEIVFSSGFTFNNKETIKNKYLKRIENPVYASKLLKHIYPPLLQFEYCGEHKPSEVLFNKYYAAVVKRIRKKMRPAYPVNFPLGDWMKEFVETYLPSCNDYDVLKETFNLNKLQKDLMCGMHQPKESYWLRFTNPIMMKFILDEYGK